MQRMLATKAGKVWAAFNKIRNLPPRSTSDAYQKASKFEKGLLNIVNRGFARCFAPFKEEYY